jgi:hypothetical protein
MQSMFKKGIGSSDEYFLKNYQINSVIFVQALMVFNFLLVLIKRKVNVKFMLVSLKALCTYSLYFFIKKITDYNRFKTCQVQ